MLALVRLQMARVLHDSRYYYVRMVMLSLEVESSRMWSCWQVMKQSYAPKLFVLCASRTGVE